MLLMRAEMEDGAPTAQQLQGLMSHLLPSLQSTEPPLKHQRRAMQGMSSAGSTMSSMGNKETEDVVLSLARLVLRHDTMLLARSRTQGYMIFLRQDVQHAIFPVLSNIAQEWNQLKTKNQVTAPLRVTLLVGFLTELKGRCQRLLQASQSASGDKLWMETVKSGVASTDGCFVERRWDATEKQMITVKEGRSIQIGKAVELVSEALDLVARPYLIERFSANVPFNKLRPTGIVAMQLMLGAGDTAAMKLQDIMGDLSGLSLWELLACSVRRDYGKQGQLGEQLQTFVKQRLGQSAE